MTITHSRILAVAVALMLCACQRNEPVTDTATPTATPPADTATVATPTDTVPADPATGAARNPLARMDADGDGTVTADEHAQAAQSRFARMDSDGDGTVTTQEMEARRPPMMGGDANMPSARNKSFDANNDGAISAEEHANASHAMFEKLDTDKNGQLSSTEMPAGRRGMMDDE